MSYANMDHAFSDALDKIAPGLYFELPPIGFAAYYDVVQELIGEMHDNLSDGRPEDERVKNSRRYNELKSLLYGYVTGPDGRLCFNSPTERQFLHELLKTGEHIQLIKSSSIGPFLDGFAETDVGLYFRVTSVVGDNPGTYRNLLSDQARCLFSVLFYLWGVSCVFEFMLDEHDYYPKIDDFRRGIEHFQRAKTLTPEVTEILDYAIEGATELTTSLERWEAENEKLRKEWEKKYADNVAEKLRGKARENAIIFAYLATGIALFLTPLFNGEFNIVESNLLHTGFNFLFHVIGSFLWPFFALLWFFFEETIGLPVALISIFMLAYLGYYLADKFKTAKENKPNSKRDTTPLLNDTASSRKDRQNSNNSAELVSPPTTTSTDRGRVGLAHRIRWLTGLLLGLVLTFFVL